MNIFSRNREITILVCLYCISYGLILGNNGLYWDDWFLTNGSDQLFDTYQSMKHLEAYYIHYFLLNIIQSTYLYKVIVFTSFLIVALIVNKTLSMVPELDTYSRFFIVALFVLFPVNNTRITLITTTGIIKYLFFYIGVYLLTMHFKRKDRLFRVLALVSFFFSFTLNSTPMLYLVVVPLILIYFGRQEAICVKDRFIRHFDFIILPFIFLLARLTFLAPTGKNVEYNHFDASSMLKALIMLPAPFYTSLLEVVLTSLNNFSGIFFIATIVLAAMVDRNDANSNYDAYNKRMLAIGILLFAAAVFPYLAVGKTPGNDDWNGRFQILTPLGASVIIYFSLKMLFVKAKTEKSIQHLMMCFVLVSFVGMNVKSYYMYKRDWYKQLSIIENLRDDKAIIDARTIFFIDKTISLNANGRRYRQYEFQGLLNYIFGKGAKNAVMTTNYDVNTNSTSDNGNVYAVTIDYGDYPLNSSNTAKLMLREVFTKELFKVNIKRSTHIESVEYKRLGFR